MTALSDVQGIGPFLERQLHEAGYSTVAALAAADPNSLVAVRGIGSISARRIIDAAELTLGSGGEASAPKSKPDVEKQPSGAKKKSKAGKKSAKAKKKKSKNAKAGKKSDKAKAKVKAKKKSKNAKAGKKSDKAKVKAKKKSENKRSKKNKKKT